MRIQHNIMAMNAYRNYNNNVSALSSNLEKLSSGYRINRAGDDAAGLAISEKMRAQITGLDAAQKNVKDGISLVKTAEGAMQEIQDMLNRMKYLAVQSANGTYEDEVDRENLQKEVDALKAEINRIADSANFNGRKLLDGSLAAEGSSANGVTGIDLSKLGVDLTVDGLKTVDAQKGTVKTEALFNGAATDNQLTVANGDTVTLTINYTDAEGAKSKDITLRVGNLADGTTKDQGLYWEDGSEDGYYLGDALKLAAAGTMTAADFAKAVEAIALKDSDLKAAFSVADQTQNTTTAATNGLSFESRVPGAEGAQITSLTMSFVDKTDTGNAETNSWNIGLTSSINVEDELTAIDLSKAKVFDLNAADSSTASTKNIQDAIFEINGQKFAFIQNATETDVDVQNALRDAGVTHWVEVVTTDTVKAADVTTMVNKIATATGLKVEQGATAVAAADGNGWVEGDTTWAKNNNGTQIVLRARESTKEIKGGGLTLQIGDTADDYNQLNVHVNDMHVAALGIEKLDISTLENAQEAEKMITDAINFVSSTRGDLGAIQNRLEHTQNNLSVMEENIQDAESTIRDTDVADEMMAYTKNNILIQSAQAMLAQANAVPQGVLQLLQ